jgi:hypothetical protein
LITKDAGSGRRSTSNERKCEIEQEGNYINSGHKPKQKPVAGSTGGSLKGKSEHSCSLPLNNRREEAADRGYGEHRKDEIEPKSEEAPEDRRQRRPYFRWRRQHE